MNEEDTPTIRLIEGQFQRVSLGADDVVVVFLPDWRFITTTQRSSIQMRLRDVFRGRTLLILDANTKIGAMGNREEITPNATA